MSKMTLSEELQWRGFINQTTLENIEEFDNKEWTFYHGFDASADSQAIGNLAAMMLDLVFIGHGHKAFLLAGGATSLVGDPGGKDKERPLQTEEVIRSNVAAAESQLQSIFGSHDFTLVNNLDWFKNINILDFLRDTGKHYGISTLVQRDYIQQRIGEGGAGMSYTEFSYTLLQGYDYNYLYEEYGVNLQLSGSDQWGNCLSGVELVRKVHGQVVHALTMPLIINKATGKKFGKSEDGAVWLDESKTSVFDFYQFWLNVDDEGVGDYLKIYTAIEPEAYDSLIAELNGAPQERASQKYLAMEVTALVHGRERAERAERISNVLFSDSPFADLSAGDVSEMKLQLPTTKEIHILDALVDSELCSSKSEARRMVEAGAVTINGEKADLGTQIQATDNGAALIKRGKNKFALVSD